MNGMNKPSAFAAPGERPHSSVTMMSVRQMRVDELVVMPDERAFDVPLFVCDPRLAPAREIARHPPPCVSQSCRMSRRHEMPRRRWGPFYFVVAGAGAGAFLLCSSTTRRAR